MTPIFVFGSNLAGRHGRGAAYRARMKHGAIYGQGQGRQGDSYAIPTKDGRDGKSLAPRYQALPLWQIHQHVETFLAYARAHPELQFEVTAIGCGLAGYTPAQIAPMFAEAPLNCQLPGEFLSVIAAPTTPESRP